MDPDQRAQSLSVAERLGATVYDLVVREVADLTPSMRRITLGADGLAGLGSLPGQDIMLSVASADGSWVRRRYSVRFFDPVAEQVVLDVVAHGDGPGARWAAGVAVGDVVEGIGPRGKVLIDPEATWHLFVGDESFTPATFSMVESLTPATPATVILEVDGADDELQLDAAACPDGPRWLHRVQSPGEASAVVLDAVRAVELPSGAGFVYLGGEFHTVAAVRNLLVERGLDKEHLSAKPYWRAHMANASHGEPVKE